MQAIVRKHKRIVEKSLERG